MSSGIFSGIVLGYVVTRAFELIIIFSIVETFVLYMMLHNDWLEVYWKEIGTLFMSWLNPRSLIIGCIGNFIFTLCFFIGLYGGRRLAIYVTSVRSK